MNAQPSIKLKQNDNINQTALKPILERQKEKLALELGGMISAVITAKENGKTVLTASGDISIQADSDKIKGDIGDEVYFKVVSVSDKPVLKQIPKPESQTFGRTLMQFKSVSDLKEMFRQSGFIENDPTSRGKLDSEQEQKEAQALSKIRRQLAGVGKADVNVMNELVASGVSLNKIDLPLLNNAIKELQVKPKLKTPKETLSDFEQGASDAKRRLNDVKSLEDNEIAFMIKSGKKLTLDNIYMLKHGAGSMEPNSEIADNLRGEIIRVLQENNLVANDENIGASKWLISYGIDLSVENLEKLSFLKNLGNMTDISLSQKASGEIDLFEYSQDKAKYNLYENYVDIIDNFPKILKLDIDSLIKRKIPLTLNNLRNSAILDTVNDGAKPKSVDAVTAKQQLMEIQLKLTHEAAVRLAAKNITISTSPLTDALETLRSQEREGYASNFRMMGHTSDAESTGIMQNLYDKLSAFEHINHNSLGNVIKMILTGTEGSDLDAAFVGGRFNFSTGIVKGADFNVNNTYAALTQAAELYDKNSTPAKISKPFTDLSDQLENYLEGIGIEATEKNLSAGRILFSNKLDITAENISQVKLVASKIEHLYDVLHPNIAASMIKEGINPLTEHIDNMLEYVDKFNDMYGDNLRDKIATFIHEADMNASYSQEERQGIVAIYRMLNTMLNNGGVGIGQIVRNKTPLTLGNMMESAKLGVKHRGGDYKIDDRFGELVNMDNRGGIRKSIESAIDMSRQSFEAEGEGNTAQQAYADMSLRTMAEHAHPEYLRQLIKKGEAVEDMSIDQVNDFLTDQKNSNPEMANKWVIESVKESAVWMQSISGADPKMVKWMIDNNMNCNINSIMSMQNAVKDPFFMGKRLNNASKYLEANEEIKDKVFNSEMDELKSVDDITGALNRLSQELAEAENQISDEPGKAWSKLNAMREARNAIYQSKELSEHGNGEYKIPVMLGDKISSLNMYFLKDNMDDENVLLALETETMGVVQVYARTTEGKLNLTVSAKHEDDIARLESNVHMLIEYIKKSGFASDSIEVTFAAEATKKGINKEVSSLPRDQWNSIEVALAAQATEKGINKEALSLQRDSLEEANMTAGYNSTEKAGRYEIFV